MTREEEIKLKIEYQLYKNNNGLQMADDEEVALRLFAAIEDIKAEIEEEWQADMYEDKFGVADCLKIIEKHIGGKESE